jgi:hypothetical protein
MVLAEAASLHPRSVAKILVLVVSLITLASLMGQFCKHVLGFDFMLGFVPLFDLNGERNVPTWYSSSMLLVCSALLALIAANEAKRGARYVLHWRALSVIFLFMSLDEVVQGHEETIAPLRSWLGAGGLFYYTWTLVGIAFVLLFVLVYLPFVAHLPSETKRLFVLSGALYVGGALGMELIQGWHDDLYGVNFGTALLTTVEEVLEMSGVVVLIYALLAYAGLPTHVSGGGSQTRRRKLRK